jgi:hypothetical protein
MNKKNKKVTKNNKRVHSSASSHVPGGAICPRAGVLRLVDVLDGTRASRRAGAVVAWTASATVGTKTRGRGLVTRRR